MMHLNCIYFRKKKIKLIIPLKKQANNLALIGGLKLEGLLIFEIQMDNYTTKKVD